MLQGRSRMCISSLLCLSYLAYACPKQEQHSLLCEAVQQQSTWRAKAASIDHLIMLNTRPSLTDRSSTDRGFAHGVQAHRVGRRHVVGRDFRIGLTRFEATTTSPLQDFTLPTTPPTPNDTTSDALPNSGISVAHPYRYHRH